MVEKLNDESAIANSKSTNATSAHGTFDEMNQFFDDVEKDSEGFKAGTRQVYGEELGEAWAQFVIEALAEFPDIMRATPQTVAEKKAEDPSQFLKRKAEFDKKFKARLSQLFSEQSPELRESQLASLRAVLGPFYDSDTVERALQDLNIVDS